MNKIFKKGKTIASVLLAIFMFISSIPLTVMAANTDADSINIGNLQSKNGSYAKYSLQSTDINRPAGYRFSAVTPVGNYSGSAIDVYYKSSYSKEYSCISNRWGKIKWKNEYTSNGYQVNKDWLSTKKISKKLDSNKIFVGGSTKKDATNAIGFDLPDVINKLLNKNDFNKTDVLHDLVADNTKLTDITKKINGELWSNFKKHRVLVVEPLYYVNIGSTVVAMTPTELAAFGQYIKKTQGLIKSSDNQKDFAWIGKYSNKLYPAIIHENENAVVKYTNIIPYVDSAKISKMENANNYNNDAYETCKNIITNAYGMGFFYDTDNPAVYLKIRYKVDPYVTSYFDSSSSYKKDNDGYIKRKSDNAYFEQILLKGNTLQYGLSNHSSFGLKYEYYHNTGTWRLSLDDNKKFFPKLAAKGVYKNFKESTSSLGIADLVGSESNLTQNTTITVVSETTPNRLILQFMASETVPDAYTSTPNYPKYAVHKNENANKRYILKQASATSGWEKVSMIFYKNTKSDLPNGDTTFGLLRTDCIYNGWIIGSTFLNDYTQYTTGNIGYYAGKGTNALRYSNTDITVVANAAWKEYGHITYHSNNKLNKTDTEDNIQVNVNHILKDIDSLNFKEKSNSVFLGWSKSPTGNVEYSNKANVKVTAAGKTIDLYAVWQPVITYSIDYNTNNTNSAIDNYTTINNFVHDNNKNKIISTILSDGSVVFGYKVDYSKIYSTINEDVKPKGWKLGRNGTEIFDNTNKLTSEDIINYCETNDTAIVTLYAVWPETKDTLIINYHGNKDDNSEVTSTKTYTTSSFTADSYTTSPSTIKINDSADGSYAWTIAKGTDKERKLSNGETYETELFQQLADEVTKTNSGYTYVVNLYGNWSGGKNVYYYGDEIDSVTVEDVVLSETGNPDSSEVTSVTIDNTKIDSPSMDDTLMDICNEDNVKDEEVQEKSVKITITYNTGGDSIDKDILIVYNMPPTLTAKDRYFDVASVIGLNNSVLLDTVNSQDAEDGDLTYNVRIEKIVTNKDEVIKDASDNTINELSKLGVGEYKVYYYVKDSQGKVTKTFANIIIDYSNTNTDITDKFYTRFISRNYFPFLNSDSILNSTEDNQIYYVAKKLNGVLYYIDVSGDYTKYKVDACPEVTIKIDSTGEFYKVFPVSDWLRKSDYISTLKDTLSNEKDNEGIWLYSQSIWNFTNEDVEILKNNILENGFDDNFYDNNNKYRQLGYNNETVSEGISYTVQNGILYINAQSSNVIPDYSKESPAPWSELTFHKVVIDDNIRYIGDYAFYNQNQIKEEIILPEKCIEIGDYAFANCTSTYGTVIFNEACETIGNHAFENCNNISYLVFSAENIKIGNYAFANCSNLSDSLTLNGNTKVGNYAFYNCYNLKSITGNLEEINEFAFAYCSNVSSYNSTVDLDAIENYSFASCKNLNSINEDNTIVTDKISKGAFYACFYLPNITIKAKEHTTRSYNGTYTGSKDDYLSDSEIFDTALHIEELSFMNCDNLNQVEILSNINEFFGHCNMGCPYDYIYKSSQGAQYPAFKSANYTLGNAVFYNCNSLKSYYSSANIFWWGYKDCEYTLVGKYVFDVEEYTSTPLVFYRNLYNNPLDYHGSDGCVADTDYVYKVVTNEDYKTRSILELQTNRID